jgi:nuclear cap-binding protein subunit 1
MVTETLLQLGSRSFSHFLNATERYSDLLRFLTPDPSSRQLVLSAIGSFWRHSSQMRLIAIDKYIQYGVLEGLDVVEWTFAGSEERLGGAETADGWTDGWKWEILRMCLDKHVGRVVAVRRKVRMVERADETARARRAAERLESGEGVGEGEGESMEAESEGQLFFRF